MVDHTVTTMMDKDVGSAQVPWRKVTARCRANVAEIGRVLANLFGQLEAVHHQIVILPRTIEDVALEHGYLCEPSCPEHPDSTLIIGRNLCVQTLETFLPGDGRQVVNQVRGKPFMPEIGIHDDANAAQMSPPSLPPAVK
jgi:hypothetical protein